MRLMAQDWLALFAVFGFCLFTIGTVWHLVKDELDYQRWKRK